MPVREEAIVYGVNAALAVARHRSEALLRVFHTRERRKVVGDQIEQLFGSCDRRRAIVQHRA